MLGPPKPEMMAALVDTATSMPRRLLVTSYSRRVDESICLGCSWKTELLAEIKLNKRGNRNIVIHYIVTKFISQTRPVLSLAPQCDVTKVLKQPLCIVYRIGVP